MVGRQAPPDKGSAGKRKHAHVNGSGADVVKGDKAADKPAPKAKGKVKGGGKAAGKGAPAKAATAKKQKTAKSNGVHGGSGGGAGPVRKAATRTLTQPKSKRKETGPQEDGRGAKELLHKQRQGARSTIKEDPTKVTSPTKDRRSIAPADKGHGGNLPLGTGIPRKNGSAPVRDKGKDKINGNRRDDGPGGSNGRGAEDGASKPRTETGRERSRGVAGGGGSRAGGNGRIGDLGQGHSRERERGRGSPRRARMRSRSRSRTPSRGRGSPGRRRVPYSDSKRRRKPHNSSRSPSRSPSHGRSRKHSRSDEDYSGRHPRTEKPRVSPTWDPSQSLGTSPGSSRGVGRAGACRESGDRRCGPASGNVRRSLANGEAVAGRRGRELSGERPGSGREGGGGGEGHRAEGDAGGRPEHRPLAFPALPNGKEAKGASHTRGGGGAPAHGGEDRDPRNAEVSDGSDRNGPASSARVKEDGAFSCPRGPGGSSGLTTESRSLQPRPSLHAELVERVRSAPVLEMTRIKTRLAKQQGGATGGSRLCANQVPSFFEPDAQGSTNFAVLDAMGRAIEDACVPMLIEELPHGVREKPLSWWGVMDTPDL